MENELISAIELDEAEKSLLLDRLWTLLEQRAAEYTQGDSDSLPTERAEALLDSICYALSAYMEATGAPAKELLRGDPRATLKAAQSCLEGEVERARLIYRAALDTRAACGNRAYRDTLRGIGAFFSRYDIRMAAHETPCDIDYPLCVPVKEGLRGVRYIAAYLGALLAENLFLARFSKERVSRLLALDCIDPEGLVINLYEPVLRNALGLALIGKDSLTLTVSEGELRAIEERLIYMTKDELTGALAGASEKLQAALKPMTQAEIAYMNEAAIALAPRIAAARDGLRHVFAVGDVG